MTDDIATATPIELACRGMTPLRPRLEPWMVDILQQDRLFDFVDRWGSPLNLLSTQPFDENIASLNRVAEQRNLDFQVYFARKANKCIEFVDAALNNGAGIDTASEVELSQVLDRSFDPSRIICTAAIKNHDLLSLCICRGVTIAIDNADEFRAIERIAADLSRQASVALRISGFSHAGEKLFSRFGVDVDDVDLFTQTHWQTPDTNPISLSGVHFHLDGYSSDQRISAIKQSLSIIQSLREQGHQVDFLDIGGGIPMSYLESKDEWNRFWQEHERALLGQRSEVTYRNDPLGRHVQNGEVVGHPNSYPYWQSHVQADWLASLLDADFNTGTIADALRNHQLQLRCEPGRSILDGCGLTIARVEFRKRHPLGHWLIGLSMNRTQCRTSSDDFLVDPLLIRNPSAESESTGPVEGYLVGAYCTESELLTLRKLQFADGVSVGDLVVFPNTAGYLMHFLESRSHQFPLAENKFI